MEKRKYKIHLDGYDDRLEMEISGNFGFLEQLMIIDRLVHVFEYDELMRTICSYMILRGGLAAILGHDYGTEYRFDGEALKEMMEKFKEGK